MAGGGADRVTLTLLRYLDRKKFEIELALMHRTGPFSADVPRDVPVHELGSGSLWTAWLPLARLLTNNPPDILFSTSSGMNLAAALAHTVSRCRARLVLSERNVLSRGGGPRRRLLITLKRVVYSRADLVTAVSHGVARELVSAVGVDEARVHVVYNPVIDDQLLPAAGQPVKHRCFSAETPVILAAGRLVAEKDFQTLLKAFALVRAEVEADLFILGEGPLRMTLETMARDLGVGPDTHFAGFDKNPFKYMRASDVFVLSSRYEGLPGVLIQAMACGAPVVATDCPSGPAEIIEDGNTGLLVPVGDPTALAHAILRILGDAELRAVLSENGRTAASRFHRDHILPRYEAAILGEEL
jgi:glycosyltransferase involved in cell wall biosynthesis